MAGQRSVPFVAEAAATSMNTVLLLLERLCMGMNTVLLLFCVGINAAI